MSHPSFNQRISGRAEANPDTRFINIADREGDLYELFALAAHHPEVGVLVRARHKRKDQSGAGFDQLMTEAKLAGTIEVEIARPEGQAGHQTNGPEPQSTPGSNPGEAGLFVDRTGRRNPFTAQPDQAVVLAAGDQRAGG